MFLKDAIAEYGFDCCIRKLSSKTIERYTNSFDTSRRIWNGIML